MRGFLIAALLCFAFCWTCSAEDASNDAPATREDVQQYFAAVHSHDMMNQMVAAMMKPMHQIIHDQYLKDKEKLPPDFEVQMNALLDDMMKDLPWDEMMDAMVPSYQKHFTKADIAYLTSFYSSPTGQKVLRQMPEIMADTMQAIMPLMRKRVDEINQRMAQQIAQMKKDSQKAPVRVPAAKD